jgi:hypothetical protein
VLRRLGLYLVILAIAGVVRANAQSAKPNGEEPDGSPMQNLVEKTSSPATESQRHRGIERPSKKIFWLATGAVYSAALTDMHDTRALENKCARWVLYCKGGFQEQDPLARPFIHQPAGVYYGTGLAVATGVNWLAWRMGKSPRWHKVWWLPQALSTGANCWGIRSYH